MEGRFKNNHQFISQQDDFQNSPENSEDSTPSSYFNDTKINSTSASTPKRSKRGVQKRVVSVPIRDVEGSKLKGETNPPPSDSWAWRKYGQKPIKGSPYPRGYYRCSSSKGCPARKQVERSRVDPTMLLVTYSSEHNHPLPTSKNNHHHHHHRTITTTTTDIMPTAAVITISAKPVEPSIPMNQLEVDVDQNFQWFSDFESTSYAMLESPILAGEGFGDDNVEMIFSMTEEDESLFADLGELPECSVVFRRGVVECCQTTG